MGVTLIKEPIILFGIKWNHNIEQLPDDIDSSTGCLVDVFYNEEYGKFALLYITPNEFNIEKNNNQILQKIKEKNVENSPYIIFNDLKYKILCQEWNNNSNTICFKEDFEKELLK
jgi:hypothetical protein